VVSSLFDRWLHRLVFNTQALVIDFLRILVLVILRDNLALVVRQSELLMTFQHDFVLFLIIRALSDVTTQDERAA
jgi:hypothetical protein